jgi:hypothetical protein
MLGRLCGHKGTAIRRIILVEGRSERAQMQITLLQTRLGYASIEIDDVTRSQPSSGTQRIETRVASGLITLPDKAIGRAVARGIKIEDSVHNTNVSPRP